MANKKIYDTVFRDYFSDKARFMSLANATFGLMFNAPDKIIINTLENNFFNELRNDVSGIFGSVFLVLAEHQRTVNPNLPFRFLAYATEMYNRYIYTNKKAIYKGSLIKVPTPLFGMFYNGKDDMSEHDILKMSDAYSTAEDTGFDLEVKVHVFNINPHKNDKLKEACPYLRDYCLTMERIDGNIKQGMSVNQAVIEAIHHSIDNGIMKEYLTSKLNEVVTMLNFEWDADEAYAAYEERGMERGMEQSVVKMLQKNQPVGFIANMLDITDEQVLKIGKKYRV